MFIKVLSCARMAYSSHACMRYSACGTHVVKFICPTCGVKLTRSASLQTHHIAFHSTNVYRSKITTMMDTPANKKQHQTKKNHR